MKIRHSDITINTENPFENCMLDRKKYAHVLRNIINNYLDGFVLAINNEWGTGKTTFIKMWQQQLVNEKYKAIYLNAWENDFEPNPIVAILAEFKNLMKSDTQVKYKSLLEKGAVISKNILPHLAKTIAKKYIGEEGVAQLIEDTTQGAAEILEDEVKSYATKKAGLAEFRKSLTEFVLASQEEKPIVCIIDELDRCRPNYAVEFLEQIKHFFSVPGIIFVLSIDKEQLGNAIRGVYGSDRINADEYLRRFIDLEYSLPTPDVKAFCKYLYTYFDFDSFFTSKRNAISELVNDRQTFLEVAVALFKQKNLTLRQQEKIFAHARLGLSFFKETQFVFPNLYLLLVFAKNFYHQFYNRLQSKQLTLQELIDEFHKVLPTSIGEDDLMYFIHLEALLVHFYNNSRQRGTERLFNQDKTSHLTSRLDSQNTVFITYLENFNRNFSYSATSIDFLLNKIDLVDEIKL